MNGYWVTHYNSHGCQIDQIFVESEDKLGEEIAQWAFKAMIGNGDRIEIAAGWSER